MSDRIQEQIDEEIEEHQNISVSKPLTEEIKKEIEVEEHSMTNDDPTQWNCNRVCAFVTSIAGAQVSSVFKWHEIDGSALDYMSTDYMVTKLSLKIGPCVKIKTKFNSLKELFLKNNRISN